MDNTFDEKWITKEIKGASEGTLIEVLHKIQDKEGFIPKKYVEFLAKELSIPISKIYSVITFYSDFKLAKRGKNLIRVCLGTACSVMHNKKNVEFINEYLGIGIGETTKDNVFTLEAVNCLGTCSLAPVVEINGVIKGGVVPEKLKLMIDELKLKESLKNKD